MITSWTAAAEQLATSAWEMGFDVASTVASAWQARCDPDATRSLVQAAHALTSGDALPSLWAKGQPRQSAEDFLAAAEEHEAQAAVLAKHARDMAAACESARGGVIAEYERAQQRAAKAQAGLTSEYPAVRAAAQAEIEAAQEIMRQMQQVIGDCDAALELLAQVRERLDYAVGCFQRVPADLEDAYEPALQLVRDGGTLPWSGDFLTGMNPVYSAGTTANG